MKTCRRLAGGPVGGDTASLHLAVTSERAAGSTIDPIGSFWSFIFSPASLTARSRSLAAWLIATWSLTKPNGSDFPSVSQLLKWTGRRGTEAARLTSSWHFCLLLLTFSLFSPELTFIICDASLQHMYFFISVKVLIRCISVNMLKNSIEDKT